MIRFFVLTGLLGGALVAYLTTAGVGPIYQLPPSESLLTKFRQEGFVPPSPNLGENDRVEEIGVFDVPPEDEEHLKQAEADFEEMMGGMDMGDMKMGASSGETMKMPSDTADSGMKMDMTEKDSGSSASDSMNMDSGKDGNMNMAAGGDTADTGKKMEGAGDSGMNMAEGSTPPMSGDMKMPPAAAEGMKMAGDAGMDMGEGGLLVTEDGPYDREIVLTMSEWKFSDMKIDVKPGERIKFTVRNGGQIPHEFMFMSPPLMQAVKYRATRADWSLYEHEALFEQALVLPGGEFSFVLKVTQPGSWMFMCMLPYHMQMGMMGQMATKGMAMDM